MGKAGKTSLASLCRYFLKLGATGFGGPIALTAAMQEDLVERRKWFSQSEFQEGMVLSQLAPGPLAAQMSMYFGWANAGAFGALLTGLAFVLPSFLIVLVLSLMYVEYGSLPWIERAFYGVGASVIALVALGFWKLSKRNLKQDYLLWGIALVNGAFTAVTEQELLWFFLLSGAAMLLLRTPIVKSRIGLALLPPFLLTGIHGTADPGTLTQILVFFTKAGAFVFGSGLAIVPFLHGGVVVEHQWLSERQFLDAVAVAMITPGPVVITVAFIGFLVAGFAGAVLAAIGVFLPCYFFTVVPAPHFSRWSKNVYVREFVAGVTAAAIGAIGGAVIVLGKRAIFDFGTVLIFALSFVLLLRYKKIPEPIVIVGAGIVGLLVSS